MVDSTGNITVIRISTRSHITERTLRVTRDIRTLRRKTIGEDFFQIEMDNLGVDILEHLPDLNTVKDGIYSLEYVSTKATYLQLDSDDDYKIILVPYEDK